MTEELKSTFAKRVRTAKPRARKYDVWDDVISGLGLRVGASGHRSFFLRRSVRGRIRSATIGSADILTVPEARREARKLLATFIDPARNDNGPRTPGHPMDAFARDFLDRYARHWKPSTLENSTYLVDKYILPTFGRMTVDAIAVEHVRDWFASMADRPGAANRSMPVLSVMMRMAELWGYRPHNSNPCKNAKRYRMRPKERFLTAEEMARLNAVLTRDEFCCLQVVAIIRLLMLTGCRAGEIVSLEWDWIKGRRIHLPDSKSGPRTVWLSSDARAVIDAIPRYSPDCPFLFPARPPMRHIGNFEHQWHRIRNEAGLPGLRLHDLRHQLGFRGRHEPRGHGDHCQAARSRLGRAHGALCPSFRPVRCGRRRPGIGPHPCGPGRKGSGAGGRSRPCPPLTSPRAWPATAGPAARTRSCSTRRCQASDCASTRRAGRSGSCRPASRDAAAASSSHGTPRWSLPRRATAPARSSLASAPAGTPPTTSAGRRRPRPCGSSRTSICRCDPHWKPSGRKTVRIYLKARILPAFGRMPLDAIGPEDVAAWFDAVSRDRPGAANRAFEILRAMMFRAEEWGLREQDTNPCLGIAKNPRKQVARFLDAGELARLGRALDAHEARWPEAVAAIRLLALTGCRRSEVLNLRWRNIGEGAINLSDSKTGPRAVPLGEAARALIEVLPGPRDPDAFLFPTHAEGRGAYSLINCWRMVCADAEVGGLRLHDLRHTAASLAVMSGEGLTLVGRLLGHRRHRTTAGYAHLADARLVETAEKVGRLIAKAMKLLDGM